MALHIQMSEEAMREMKRTNLINKLLSFGICSGFLLLFGGILYFTILIIQGEIPTEFIAYVPPSGDGPPTNNPVQRELSAKTSTTTPTVTPSVIVAQNAVGAVAAPVSFDTTGELDFDNSLSLDIDTDFGDGLGSAGGGLGSSQAGGSALEGTFYDLKLTRGGSPSNVMKDHYAKYRNPRTNKDEYNFSPSGNPKEKIPAAKNGGVASQEVRYRVTERLNALFVGNNKNALSAFYASPTKLFASSFYLPATQDDYAPAAFKCEDVCKPAAWIVVYTGRVKAPKTGKFRFIGVGDDFLGVRFNNKVVLESGYILPSLWKKESKDSFQVDDDRQKEFWRTVKSLRERKVPGYENFEGYEQVTFPTTPLWNQNLGGLTKGKVFEVKEGEVYPIQVVLAEIPGGAFGMCLLIEDVTDGVKADGTKVPYDLFRTNFNLPTEKQIKEELAAPRKQADGTVRRNSLWHQTDKTGKPIFGAPAFNQDSLIWEAKP